MSVATGCNVKLSTCIPGNPDYRVNSQGQDALDILHSYGCTYIRSGFSTSITDKFIPPKQHNTPPDPAYTVTTTSTITAAQLQTFWARAAAYGMTIIAVIAPPTYAYTDGTHKDNDGNAISYISNYATSGALPANTAYNFSSGTCFANVQKYFGSGGSYNLLAYNPNTILDNGNEMVWDSTQLAEMLTFYQTIKASGDSGLANMKVTYGGWAQPPGGAGYVNNAPDTMIPVALSPRVLDVVSVHCYIYTTTFQQDMTTFFTNVGTGMTGSNLPVLITEMGVSNGINYSPSDYRYTASLSTQQTNWTIARQVVTAAVSPVPTLTGLLAFELCTATETVNGVTATNSSGHTVVLTTRYSLLNNDLTPFPAASIALTAPSATPPSTPSSLLIPNPGTTLSAMTNASISFQSAVDRYMMANYNTSVGAYYEEDTAASPASPYLPPAVSASQPSAVMRDSEGLGALNVYPTGAGLVLNGGPGGLVIRGYQS